MAAAYTFTLEQIERMKGQESAAKLAQDFGCSDMPIRRYRNKIGWVKEFVLPTPPAPGIVKDGPSEVDMLRDEVRRLKSQARRTDKSSVGDERVLRAIEEALTAVEPVTLPPLPDIERGAGSGAHHQMVLLFSDLHYGEVVDGAQMNGINSYNPAVAEDRVAQLVKSVLAFKRARPAVHTLHFWALGDMSSGSIHALEETNAVPAAEQFVRAGYLMADAVRQLAPHFDRVECAGIVGNHPRPAAQPASSDAHNNGDWVAYQLARALAQGLPNVAWTVPKSAQLVREVSGRKFLLWHGDGVRSSMPGVPWGGVSRRWNELKSTYASQGIMLDYVAVGHFHQANVTGTGVFMNGSVIGPNAYGLKNFGGGQSATQLLLTLDDKHRRLTDVAYITFEDADSVPC